MNFSMFLGPSAPRTTPNKPRKCIDQYTFNDSGAALAPHLTKQTIKMHGKHCIFNDWGAASAPHSTKQAMKMYGNLYISNDSEAVRPPPKQTMNIL